MNVMLNKVKTGFESFEKDSLSATSPEEYPKRRIILPADLMLYVIHV